MASRFTVVKPVDFNIPVLQAPLELMAATLQDAQTSKDEYDKMIELMPKHLTEGDHVKFAEDYKALMGNIREGVSQAFASGDTGKALRMLQEAKGLIRKENTPGGLGHALETAYTTYQENLKQLEEKFKEDIKAGNNINYQYAKEKMKPVDLKYNYETGSYNLTPGSNVPTYFDVDKHLQEWLKTMKPSEYGFTQFSEDGKWLIDEEGKRYNAREMAMELMNDPRVQQQNQISADFSAMQMGEEGRNKYAEQLNQSMTMAKQQELETFGEISKMLASKNANDRKKGQAALASLGLTVDGEAYGRNEIDGQVGDRTKKALAMVQEKINEPVTPYTGDDVSKLLYRELQTGIANKAEAALPDSRTLKWRANEYELENRRHRNRLAEQKAYADLWKENTSPTVFGVQTTPYSFDALDNAMTATIESLNGSRQGLMQVINSSGELQTLLGGNSTNLDSKISTLGSYVEALKSNEYNIEKTAEQLGVSTQTVQALSTIMRNPAYVGLESRALEYVESERSLNELKRNEEAFAQVYVDRNASNIAGKTLKSYQMMYNAPEALKKATPEQFAANPEKYIAMAYEKEIKDLEAQIVERQRKHEETARRYEQKGVKYNKAKDEAEHKRSIQYTQQLIEEKKKRVQSLGQTFREKLRVEVKEDMKKNRDRYVTAIPQGWTADDQYNEELKNNFNYLNSIPDENGNLEWTEGGKKADVKINPSNVVYSVQSAGFGKRGQTVVMQAFDPETGKTVEKRSYIANPANLKWMQNYSASALATAINKDDMTGALMVMNSLKPYDPRYKAIANPEGNNYLTGTYIGSDGSYSSSPVNFNVAKTFPVKETLPNGDKKTLFDLAYVGVKQATGEVTWNVVKLPHNWRDLQAKGKPITMMQEKDLLGQEDAVYDEETAQAVFNLQQELYERKYIGTVAGLVKRDNIEQYPSAYQSRTQ